MPRGRRFDHEAIVALGREGLPPAEIARRLGCHQETARRVLDMRPAEREACRARHERGRCRERRVLELYAAGTQIRAITQELGCSHATVHAIIRRAGVPMRKPRR